MADVENLESFVVLLRSTRERLRGSLPTLDLHADTMNASATVLASRLRVVNDTASLRLDGLTALQLAAATAVAGLAAEAGALAGARFAAARARLESLDDEIETGLTQVREALARTVSEREADFGEVESGLAELEDAAAPLQQVLAEPGLDADATARLLAEADAETQAALFEAYRHLTETLEPVVQGTLALLREHFDRTAQPYLVEAVDRLGAAASGAFDDLANAIEQVGDDLTEAASARLGGAAEAVRDATRQHEGASGRVETEAVATTCSAADRARSAFSEGSETSSAMAVVAPRLAAAKDVAQQVEDLLDALNPLG